MIFVQLHSWYKCSHQGDVEEACIEGMNQTYPAYLKSANLAASAIPVTMC